MFSLEGLDEEKGTNTNMVFRNESKTKAKNVRPRKSQGS